MTGILSEVVKQSFSQSVFQLFLQNHSQFVNERIFHSSVYVRRRGANAHRINGTFVQRQEILGGKYSFKRQTDSGEEIILW